VDQCPLCVGDWDDGRRRRAAAQPLLLSPALVMHCLTRCGMTESQEPIGEVVAMVPLSLHPHGEKTSVKSLLELAPVSLNWQQLGSQADFFEMHGTTRALPEGRMYEIAGRAAAAGEQLGLALAALSDAHEWMDPANETRRGRGMGARATAEVSGYYAKGAAHGLANVALRTLTMNEKVEAELTKRFKSAKGFEPFSEAKGVWQSLNEPVADDIVAAIPATFGPEMQLLDSLLVDLVKDPAWIALANRRDVDYHRWRPQSISGGVEPEMPWDSSVPGSKFIDFGGSSRYIPTEPSVIVAEATDGVVALGTRMGEWLEAWPTAVNELMTEQGDSPHFIT
jgi:hypothetical protein